MKLLHGDSAARLVSQRVAEPAATTAALKAIPVDRRVNGMLAITIATMELWVYDEASVIAASATILVPDAGAGRWRRIAAAAAA